jgi:Choline/ethanolamine kinase
MAIGIDCSDLIFIHADLGLTNIIVEDEPNSGKVRIIDFETAGYLPQGWIRSKFRVSAGMDLSTSVRDPDGPYWFRAEVQKGLGANGFGEVRNAWMEWRESK